MLSKPILSSNKPKMSWFEYIFQHCIPTGFQNFSISVKMWISLLQGDYEDYRIYNSKTFKYTEEELFQMMRDDFWYSLEDDVMEKEFLEYLLQMVEDVETGKVQTIPWSEELFDEV